MKTRNAGIAVLLAACVLLGSASVQAVPIPLDDLNSHAEIDIDSQSGVFSWKVDGIENLRKQWFWFRIGDLGPEQSIDVLGPPASRLSDGDLDLGNERLIARYTGQGFTITADYLLTGGPVGSGASDMAEVISIQNTGAGDLDFHFFQYVDFELKGDADDVSVEIKGGNTAVQKDTNTWLSETVVTWMPDHHEVGIGGSLLAKLTDAAPTTLDDTSGPVGPGDLSWGFQWDVNLGEGDTFIISKDKNLVPEPACLAVLGFGSLVLALRRRKRA